MNQQERRETARHVFATAVAAVQPARLIANAVYLQGDTLRVLDTEYLLQPGRKIYIFGSGKASAGMAGRLLALLATRVGGGVIVTNMAAGDGLFPLVTVQGSHPVPDAESIRADDLLIDGLSALEKDDFFIYLLSGGSSALVEKPVNSISLAEMQETTRVLLKSNVPIQEINAVRKHLSLVKGGRLGQCTRASGIVLVISDVIGDDLSVIGSGPFYRDRTTYQLCYEILQRGWVWDRIPTAVQTLITSGVKGLVPETPREQNISIRHFLLGTNRIALEQACHAAEEAGLYCRILSASLDGEARQAGQDLVTLARDVSRRKKGFKLPACLLFGGETTVTVHGPGRGGRNQELALAALATIGKMDNILLLSGGTDGIDGNSSAAGAIADSGFFREAQRQGLSIEHFLTENDSNTFFVKVGGLLETGPTGTNVMDITLLIIDKEDL
jgi:hydroxypyruvate reductase/glycerate 2-kinase